MLPSATVSSGFRRRPRILIVPGWLSRARAKSALLRMHGYDVRVPSVSNWSITKARAQVVAAVEAWQPDVIIGSSRGGAVMMGIQTEVPIILVAPAWRFFGVSPVVRCSNVTILHSRADRTVVIEDSVFLSSANPHVKLVVAGHTHSLTCRSGSKAILSELGRYLNSERRFR